MAGDVALTRVTCMQAPPVCEPQHQCRNMEQGSISCLIGMLCRTLPSVQRAAAQRAARGTSLNASIKEQALDKPIDDDS